MSFCMFPSVTFAIFTEEDLMHEQADMTAEAGLDSIRGKDSQDILSAPDKKRQQG